MSLRHFIKWVPERWRKDLGVQSSSLAARGLWNELLQVMHACEPYGHLVINGQAPTVEEIAALVGSTKREVARLLAELERKGVFSRTPAGVIYSRKYVRDEKEYREAAANGKKGGNPNLKRAEPLEGGITPSPTAGDNGSLCARAPVRSLEDQKTHQSASTRAREAPPGSEPDPPPLTAADVEPSYAPHLRMHPTLDVPDVRAALDRWERHLREKGRSPTSVSWESNLVRWERWGPARLVRNVARTIEANLATVIDAQHGDEPEPVASAPREPEPGDADELREWWDRRGGKRRVADPNRPGRFVEAFAQYPGHEAARSARATAKAELDERNGSAA